MRSYRNIGTRTPANGTVLESDIDLTIYHGLLRGQSDASEVCESDTVESHFLYPRPAGAEDELSIYGTFLHVRTGEECAVQAGEISYCYKTHSAQTTFRQG